MIQALGVVCVFVFLSRKKDLVKLAKVGGVCVISARASIIANFLNATGASVRARALGLI
jgi:hypothetical protein